MSDVPMGAAMSLQGFVEQHELTGGDRVIGDSSRPRSTSLTRSLPLVAKRSIDVVGAGAGLLLLSPILVLLALMICLHSRGPVLFRQTRVGHRGREFRVLKFRTMVVDAEAKLKDLEHLNESPGQVLFKMKADPRVTTLGRFLRKSSLDELPQLVNVLLGQMSLVGPRPLQLRDCNLLKRADPEGYHRRLNQRPGLSGPWQVSGRSDVAFDQMLKMDIEYIDNWSLGLDLCIILKTVQVVITGRGAC